MGHRSNWVDYMKTKGQDSLSMFDVWIKREMEDPTSYDEYRNCKVPFRKIWIYVVLSFFISFHAIAIFHSNFILNICPKHMFLPFRTKIFKKTTMLNNSFLDLANSLYKLHVHLIAYNLTHIYSIKTNIKICNLLY